MLHTDHPRVHLFVRPPWLVCIRRGGNHVHICPIKHGGCEGPQGDAGETDEKS